MGIVSLTAEEIAKQQLLASIRLWHEADYLSALTLAGAAEEIMGKRLRALGKEPSFDQWKNLIVSLGKSEAETEPKIDEMIGKLLNKTRNLLKHYAGDEAVEIDIREDSTEMVERAIANYHQLTGTVLDEAFTFWTAASSP
jgi:SpoVK/Ycf46/Vps4 family AAA+-type ATPase